MKSFTLSLALFASAASASGNHGHGGYGGYGGHGHQNGFGSSYGGHI